MKRRRSNLQFADLRPLFPPPGAPRWCASALVCTLLAANAGCTTHLGFPPRAALTRPPPTSGLLSLDTPIEQICARPDGKAVVDRDLPGLTTRPEYPVFKAMSLKTLAAMSNGKLTSAKLAQVGADLAGLPPSRP